MDVTSKKFAVWDVHYKGVIKIQVSWQLLSLLVLFTSITGLMLENTQYLYFCKKHPSNKTNSYLTNSYLTVLKYLFIHLEQFTLILR